MPAPPSNENFRHTPHFFAAGLILLAIILLTPPNADQPDNSFFALARASSWFKPGDWMATWCSFKIILLGWSGFLIIVSVFEFLNSLQRDKLARWLRILFVLPIFTFLLGCYYFVKALL